ncbi:unnamed protein product [marine sediment metagenome]|uniref:Uncharacterized protein n=1 Tax=marine sediment metagenome TaxID=412755 RepID=X1RFI3_9ZZZZ
MAACSLPTPIAVIIKTRVFSLIPIPPIEIGTIAMIVTTGTINIKAVKFKLIPKDFAAKK